MLAASSQNLLSRGLRRAEFEADFPMPPKTFPRAARLLRHGDFERVYKQGRRHFSTSMTVFYWQRAEEEGAPPKQSPASAGLRVGFTVGRALGRAVERNRMKRRLREAVRLSLPERAVAVDVVINPKKVLLRTEFKTLVDEIQRAFRVVEQRFSRDSESVKGSALSRGAGARPVQAKDRP